MNNGVGIKMWTKSGCMLEPGINMVKDVPGQTQPITEMYAEGCETSTSQWR